MLAVRADGDGHRIVIEVERRGAVSHIEFEVDAEGQIARRGTPFSPLEVTLQEALYASDINGDGDIGFVLVGDRLDRGTDGDLAIWPITGGYIGLVRDGVPTPILDARGAAWLLVANQKPVSVRDAGDGRHVIRIESQGAVRATHVEVTVEADGQAVRRAIAPRTETMAHAAVTTSDITWVPAPFMAALSPADAATLKRAPLSSAQVARLSPDAQAALAEAALAELPSPDVSPAVIPPMTPEQIVKLNAALADAQLAALTPDQVLLLGANGREDLVTGDPLPVNARLPNLSDAQRNALTTLDRLCHNEERFKAGVSWLDLSGVIGTREMFAYVAMFNQPLAWNTRSVTDMPGIFAFAGAFDQDIGGWNVREVRDMSAMFEGALAFSRDIGSWDVRNVTSMANMFADASSFDQDLGRWNVSAVTAMSGMFEGSGMSMTNMDGTLVGWADIDTHARERGLQENATLGLGTGPGAVSFSNATAVQKSRDSWNWTINKGIQATEKTPMGRRAMCSLVKMISIPNSTSPAPHAGKSSTRWVVMT